MYKLSILVTLIIIVIQLHCTPDYVSNQEQPDKSRTRDDPPEQRGIIWTYGKKILHVEQFVPVSFVLPYPTYDSKIDSYIKNLTKTLRKFWKKPNLPCDDLKYANQSEEAFSFEWLLKSVENEHLSATMEVKNLKTEIEGFLKMDPLTGLNRKKRGAAAVALGLGAATGIFGAGLGLGSQVGCALRGIFGTCQDMSKANQRNIKKLYKDIGAMKDEVLRVQNVSNEKFFLVAAELKELRKHQDSMTRTQKENMHEIERQFEILNDNVGSLRDCVAFLYSRDEILHNSDVLVGLLLNVLGHVRAYRSAFYTYRINLLNSVPTLLQKLLPPSLISKKQLKEILTILTTMQTQRGNRLSLAIPMPEILAYYESQLIIDLAATDVGIVCHLAIPMASSQTVLTVYRANLIPMPDPKEPKAHIWKVDAKYLAVSANHQEFAELNDEDLDRCVGSPLYSICAAGFATVQDKGSCLTTLFYKNTHAAVAACKVVTIDLPSPETATNIGDGRWLILSANKDFELTEYKNANGMSTIHDKHHGCRVCVIVLECNSQIQGPNIILRPDLESCHKMEKGQRQIHLADPLVALFNQLPDVTDLPNFRTREEAQHELLREVRLEIYRTRSSPTSDNLMKIAKPITMNLRKFDERFDEKFAQYTPWKVSLTAGVISFCVSALLHMAYTHYVKRRIKLTSHFPFVHEEKSRFIKTIPIVTTSKENYDFLIANPEHPLHKSAIVIPIEDELLTFERRPEITANESTYTHLRTILRGLQHRRHRRPDAMNTMPTNLTANAPINDTTI